MTDFSVPVLIQGESGTGKELVSRCIHQHSLRSSKPFMAVNCAAIPKELIESELFGYVQGAFTGANQKRREKFHLANNGTLFLDEIGSIPLEVQEKILRVVQYNVFERVGSSESIDVDVRIIAATNADLNALTRKKRFKQDLLDRLSFEVLFLPPLRARKEDISLIASHFAGRMALELGREEIPVFSQEAVKAMEEYTWPGNIRELENIIEHAFVLCSESTIRLQHLPGSLSLSYVASDETQADPVKTAQIKMISDALIRNNHNRTAAAKDLGIHKSTLFRRIKKLGMRL